MPRLPARDELLNYEQAKTLRSPYESQWRMAAAYVRPQQLSRWQTTGPVIEGQNTEARRYAYDATGVNSILKYKAVLHRIATPDGLLWHRCEADNKALMKISQVRTFFDDLTKLLFKMRYSPRAGFSQARGETYGNMGVYGNGPYSLTWRKPTPLDRRGGFRYQAWPMSDIFVLPDDEGMASTFYRRFYLNARQFKLKFGEERAPANGVIAAELKKPNPDEGRKFEIVHIVKLRDDYDPNHLSARRHPYCSNYIAVEGADYVKEEEGFLTQLYIMPRTDTDAGDTYAYSPSMQALPALGGVNAAKKTMTKVGHRAADPVLLANDDGALSGRLDQRPGRTIWGGLDSQGRKMVAALETGANFRVAEKIIEDERKDIREAYHATLFDILLETGEMKATQVMERMAKETSLLAPLMGRQQTEDLGPSIEREVALLREHGYIVNYGEQGAPGALELPPELVEAEGEYSIAYTSPLAKNLSLDEVNAYFRLQEQLAAKAAAVGNTDVLEWLNEDEAIPAIADITAIPSRWIRTPEQMAARAEQSRKQQMDSEMLAQAPAAASVITTSMKGDNKIAA